MLGGINQTIKEFVAGNKGVHQKGNKEKETKFERKWRRKKNRHMKGGGVKREGWDGDWVISLCLCSLIPYDLLCSILPEFYSFLISTQSSKLGGGVVVVFLRI